MKKRGLYFSFYFSIYLVQHHTNNSGDLTATRHL